MKYPAELADQQYVINAIAVDAAGNKSAASSDFVLNVDTSKPATPTINTVAQDDKVTSAEHVDGEIVTGTAEANSSVKCYLGKYDQSCDGRRDQENGQQHLVKQSYLLYLLQLTRPITQPLP